MARRKGRIEQFAYPVEGGFGTASFYTYLLSSAELLLHSALTDRATFARNRHTHGSVSAPGAVVLVVTAFDVWMNEVVLGMLLPQDDARTRLNDPMLSKYRFLYPYFHGTEAPPNPDLDTAILIRDEIVHHFQRPDPTLIPGWFRQAQERGRLLTHPMVSEGRDYSFTQKLCSYGLAYWVFEIVEASVRTILIGGNNPRAELQHAIHNFGLYRRQVCAPSHLEQFDAEHGVATE